MNPAIEAGKAIERAKKMREKCEENIEKLREKLTLALDDVEAGLSEPARAVYRSLK